MKLGVVDVDEKVVDRWDLGVILYCFLFTISYKIWDPLLMITIPADQDQALSIDMENSAGHRMSWIQGAMIFEALSQ